MLTHAQIKLTRSLQTAKARKETGLFVAEGPKLVGELLHTMRPHMLVVQEGCDASAFIGHEVLWAKQKELERASGLQAPQGVIGVFHIPAHTLPLAADRLILALDGVQDPGNLGTILRLADWFGITDVVCSPTCASAYCPKAVQASMGALARVHVHTTELPAWIDTLPHGTPVYGTLLGGDNIYSTALSTSGVIVMGSEGKGLTTEVESRVCHRLLIPPYPTQATCVESLNVAMATAITLSEFRRRETQD